MVGEDSWDGGLGVRGQGRGAFDENGGGVMWAGGGGKSVFWARGKLGIKGAG